MRSNPKSAYYAGWFRVWSSDRDHTPQENINKKRSRNFRKKTTKVGGWWGSSPNTDHGCIHFVVIMKQKQHWGATLLYGKRPYGYISLYSGKPVMLGGYRGYSTIFHKVQTP
jgi:hypothetical protein